MHTCRWNGLIPTSPKNQEPPKCYLIRNSISVYTVVALIVLINSSKSLDHCSFTHTFTQPLSTVHFSYLFTICKGTEIRLAPNQDPCGVSLWPTSPGKPFQGFFLSPQPVVAETLAMKDVTFQITETYTLTYTYMIPVIRKKESLSIIK